MIRYVDIWQDVEKSAVYKEIQEMKEYLEIENARKEIVTYFKSWFDFVEKQNRKAKIVFDRVRYNDKRKVMNR